jgi:hypothetical protein
LIGRFSEAIVGSSNATGISDSVSPSSLWHDWRFSIFFAGNIFLFFSILNMRVSGPLNSEMNE